MADLANEVTAHRRKVITDSYTMTWSEALALYSSGDVRIDPEYQRMFRWSHDQQTQFIESILLNIPTPPVFFAENANGKFELIDGLQRFSTMLKFFASETFGRPKLLFKKKPDAINDIRIPTILAAGPILSSLKGVTLAAMPEQLTRTIRYARIPVVLLKKESDALTRYTVFHRLNRSGSPLSDQEIRNSAGRLYDNEFPDKLRQLARDKKVCAAMGLSQKQLQDMTGDENLLRLLAFNYSKEPLEHDVSHYLDSFNLAAALRKFTLTKKIESYVLETFHLIARAYPQGEAFRHYRNGEFQWGFSSNLFDIVASGVFANVENLRGKPTSFLRKKIRDLHSTTKLAQLTGAGSNTRKKMKGRITFGKRWFKT